MLLLAAAAALFHLWTAGVAPLTALVQRPIHLALFAFLGFLGLGVRRRAVAPPFAPAPAPAFHAPSLLSWALALLSLVSFLYLAFEHQALVRRSGTPTMFDLALGVVALVLVLALARRAAGWGLVAVASLALAYAFVGPWLPGVLAHRGYSIARVVEHLYLSTEGIWGIPLGVSADFVYLFILFGAVFDVAGGGSLLIALADRVAGRTRGGPAKTAAVASCFMGSLSGSAVANVVTTGAFTIPLMKRVGFKPHFAGGIEAAASTGGQLMPPVMGAGAFILATWTSIPYVEVALAALIPALLYYGALLMAIHFRAAKVGIAPMAPGIREPVLNRLHLLIPLVIIVSMLAMGRSPMRAAFWGVASAAALALLRRDTRPGFRALEAIVMKAAAGTVQVAAACAAAGIVVGIATLTGIGLRMSELIITLSGGHLLPALGLTALGSIVLGMGLPTTAAYVVLAALGAPALVELGVPLLAAHLFIFYFGCISNVTPPVSLAAYAAAGVAGSDPLQTSFSGVSLAVAGFLVPFSFVYGPPLLLVGSPLEIAFAFATGIAGVTALAAAVIGYGRRPLRLWERALLLSAAVTLIFPGVITDGYGFIVLVALMWRGEGPGASIPGTIPVEMPTDLAPARHPALPARTAMSAHPAMPAHPATSMLAPTPVPKPVSTPAPTDLKETPR
jgi:TRAP transporter 4TM/12TM fusion protein